METEEVVISTKSYMYTWTYENVSRSKCTYQAITKNFSWGRYGSNAKHLPAEVHMHLYFYKFFLNTLNTGAPLNVLILYYSAL